MYEIKEPRKATSKQSKHCSPRDYSTYRSRQSIELECALERQTSRKIRLPKLLNLYLLDYHVFQILDRNMKKEMFQSALVTSPSFLSSFVLPLPSLLGGGTMSSGTQAYLYAHSCIKPTLNYISHALLYFLR